MPTLQELRRKAKTITVDWKVDDTTVVPFQVTYDPGKITMGSQEITDDNMTLREFWESRILLYVKSWDILDGGQPVPITPEGVAELEAAMVETILQEIQADARPKPKSTTST